MSKQHTPTTDLNIGFDEDGDVLCITQGDRDVAYMAYQGEQGKKDGERILRAVNNHERLVEALEDIIECIKLPYELNFLSLNADEKYLEVKQLLTELKS